MEFEDFSLQPEILKSLKQLGLREPTEVQAKSIFPQMEGKDVIVRAKTGSGKTFAFLLPILNKDVKALILTPTRELAQQISKEARKIKKTPIALLYGGVGINPQINALKDAQLIIATPGRLLDHIGRKTIDLSNVRYVVLDEADRMLDMGFIDDVKKILNHVPKERQTALFSATMPEAVVDLARHYMNKPQKLLLQQEEITVKDIKQIFCAVDRKAKIKALIKELCKAEKVLIFCNTKSWAESLTNILKKKGYKVLSVHSGLSQNKRTKAIERFNKGEVKILVASDVAARGLDIENVTHVINYDVPRNPKDYIHRIGRTGRAGKKGIAITFVTNEDYNLVKNIEEEVKMFFQIKDINNINPQKAAIGSDWGLD